MKIYNSNIYMELFLIILENITKSDNSIIDQRVQEKVNIQKNVSIPLSYGVYNITIWSSLKCVVEDIKLRHHKRGQTWKHSHKKMYPYTL